MHTISDAISFLSVYSFSCPLCKKHSRQSHTHTHTDCWHASLLHWPTNLVHFEVDNLSTTEGYDHLPLVQGAACNGLLAWSSPFIHTFVCTDVADAVRVHLRQHTHMPAADTAGQQEQYMRPLPVSRHPPQV